MARQTVYKFVMAPLLRGLVAVIAEVARSGPGCVEQSQAQRVVIGLIGAIFAIGQNSDSVPGAFVGQIKPLVSGDFELSGIIVGATDGADFPVVGGLGIGGG